MRVSISNNLDEIYSLETEILDQVAKADFDDNAIFAIRLSLDEALINAYRHGNRMEPGRRIHVDYNVSRESVEIQIEDEGNGFRLQDIPDPRRSDTVRRTHGRGIFLIRNFMADVAFNKLGNIIRFRYEPRPDWQVDHHGLPHWRCETVEIVEVDSMRINKNPAIIIDSVRRIIECGIREVVLDMRLVDRVNSAFLGMLVGVYWELKKNDGYLALIRLQEGVATSLEKTALCQIIPVFDDLGDFISSRP